MDDVVAIITDLFFQSRVEAAGRAAGRRLRYLASSDAVRSVEGYALALVDIDAALDVPAAIRDLKQVGVGPVIAFGPHLDTDRRKEARAAGADRVLAKSKFVTELPRLMSEQQTSEGMTGGQDLEAALAELAEYGRRMEELGKLLQDREAVRRVYLAPSPHVEEARAHGEPIVLQAAHYGDFLAVQALRPKLERVRSLSRGS